MSQIGERMDVLQRKTANALSHLRAPAMPPSPARPKAEVADGGRWETRAVEVSTAGLRSRARVDERRRADDRHEPQRNRCHPHRSAESGRMEVPGPTRHVAHGFSMSARPRPRSAPAVDTSTARRYRRSSSDIGARVRNGVSTSLVRLAFPFATGGAGSGRWRALPAGVILGQERHAAVAFGTTRSAPEAP